MSEMLTLEEFYRTRTPGVPAGLRQDLGHFNVFHQEEYGGPQAQPVLYSRKDFYKISLVTGRNRYHYADKVVTAEGSALLFANPRVPYHWQPLGGPQQRTFCIFTEAFLAEASSRPAGSFPVFAPGGQPLYLLTEAQRADVQAIFDKMLGEIDSGYTYKYDLLRAYVLELIHGAQKLAMAPALGPRHPAGAAMRIASLFTELLARQFPIERPGQRVGLRTAQAFADQLAVHVNYLNRALKAATGKTTSQLLGERLAQEAQALLLHTSWPVAQVGYCLGFEEPARFTQFFRRHTGRVPSAVRGG